jgi:cell surface protein SprA
MDTAQIRNISNVTNYMSHDPLRIGRTGYMTSGRDFEKIENARRLSNTEFTLNSKLGFISLNVNLNANQTLAVAYQYTIVGSDEVYQVGEFSDQGINTPNVLYQDAHLEPDDEECLQLQSLSGELAGLHALYLLQWQLEQHPSRLLQRGLEERHLATPPVGT